jgi:DNA-binding transcriptional regulator YhcF (GntR family)
MTTSVLHRAPALNTTVYDRLKKQVRTMSPGTALTSERRLAADLGVSRPTLRHALDRLRADGLLATRQGSGTFVTAHVKQKTVITLYYNNDLGQAEDTYRACYQALHDTTVAAGHRMELLLNREPHLRSGPPLTALEACTAPDALVLLGIMDAAYVRQALDLGVPVLTVDFAVPGTDTDAVTFDSFGAGCQMMEHLVVNGHTRAAFIGGYRGSPHNRRPEADSLRVRAGLEYTAQLHGAVLADEWSTTLPMGDGASAAAFIRQCLAGGPPPTGIIFFDPAHAEAVLPVLEAHGLTVPGDISIICRGQAEKPAPGRRPVTTVPVSIVEMGRSAARALQLRLDGVPGGPMHIAIPSPLLDRGTVAAPAGVK